VGSRNEKCHCGVQTFAESHCSLMMTIDASLTFRSNNNNNNNNLIYIAPACRMTSEAFWQYKVYADIRGVRWRGPQLKMG